MYHEAHIQALSKSQISRLLNGHPVRIKHGNHHKIHLSTEHLKKLHKASHKGGAATIALDPYAIMQNQHLRNLPGASDFVHNELRASKGGTLLIDQPFTVREAVNEARDLIGKGSYHHHHRRSPRGKRGGTMLIDQPFTVREAVNEARDFVRDPKGTLGFGMKHRHHGKGVNHLKKFQKWTSALGDVAKSVGDYIAPVAKPLFNGAVNMALNKMGQPGGIDIYAQPEQQSHFPEPVYATPIAPEPKYKAIEPSYAQTQVEHFTLPPLPDNYAIPYGKSYASGLKRKSKRGGDFLGDISSFAKNSGAAPYMSLAAPYVKQYAPGVASMVGMGRKHPRAKRVMSEAQKAALAKGRAKLRHTLNEKYGIGDGMKRKRGASLRPAGYGFDEC